MRISIKENEDKEINVKVHKSFDVVQSIMPISTDEIIFLLFKKYSTRIKYQNITTTKLNHKITKPKDAYTVTPQIRGSR